MRWNLASKSGLRPGPILEAVGTLCEGKMLQWAKNPARPKVRFWRPESSTTGADLARPRARQISHTIYTAHTTHFTPQTGQQPPHTTHTAQITHPIPHITYHSAPSTHRTGHTTHHKQAPQRTQHRRDDQPYTTYHTLQFSLDTPQSIHNKQTNTQNTLQGSPAQPSQTQPRPHKPSEPAT